MRHVAFPSMVALLALLPGAALACSLLNFDDRVPTEFPDADPYPEVDAESIREGGGGGDGGGQDVIGGPGVCRGTKGPLGVKVGSYCIDSTEVTAAQYEEFENTPSAGTGNQPAICTGNTLFVRQTPGGTANQPARNMNWCAASAFCKWAGKYLCGKIGGGVLLASEEENPKESQWTAACMHKGTDTFPYGPTLVAGACRDNTTGLSDVGSAPGCEGGYPGIFDMNGNVHEWEDVCEDTIQTAQCAIRGGSAFDTVSGQDDFTCTKAKHESRMDPKAEVGFRCCADLK